MFKEIFSVIACAICLDPTRGLSKQCSSSPFIVNGNKVPIEKIPWQAYIQLEGGYCGGSIIGPKWILTAAHCTNRQILRIRVGSPARGCGGLLVDVKDVIIHPHYNSSILDYDVALLGLKEELDLKQSDKIKAIALPNPNSCLVEEMLCSVSGWGDTENSNESAEWLREATVPIVNQYTCENYDSNKTITERMVCAGYKQQIFTGFTNGDAGGPLICKDIDDGQEKLFGVVSFPVQDINDYKLGVYARTYHSIIHNWILETTGITEDAPGAGDGDNGNDGAVEITTVPTPE